MKGGGGRVAISSSAALPINSMPPKPLQPDPESQAVSKDSDPLAWHRLLGTTPQPEPSLAHLDGKRLLITGAGGSIGSALATSIAPAAATLILLDTAETALYEIDRDLRALGHNPISILGSITNPALLTDLFRTHRPEIVLHAAAYKHVPLLEQNPFAAIANNVLGTHTLLEAAAHHQAARLLLVSTDKAVAPHSLMGASKRLAELLCLVHPLPTTVVRLGNVLGSHGSVVPLFLHQLTQGHPLTVTHPHSRRFFLTLDQAVQAIIEALAVTGTSSLLASNLTHQIRIVDLARHLIELHASSSEIVFTVLRPGDKLEESLISPEEHWLPTNASTSNLRAIQTPTPAATRLQSALSVLEQAIEARDLSTLLRIVQQLVPDYTPTLELLSQLPQTEVAQA
jgi:FlaA1/EpsC-like NDP-sugar epimerase